jgi:hypothetical protein
LPRVSVGDDFPSLFGLVAMARLLDANFWIM